MPSFVVVLDFAYFWLALEESKSIRGEWVDPTAGKITYREWSERWLGGLHSIKPKTFAGYESLLRSRVLPHGHT